MTRYRRRSPTPSDDAGAFALSLVVGAGVALATFYVTRLLLARDELMPRSLGSERAPRLPPPEEEP